MPAFNQAELLKSLKPKLLAIAATFSSDRSTQQDLCQEAWIDIWQYISRNPDANHPNKFYGQMAKRKMHDIYIRSYKTFGAPIKKRSPGSITKDVPHEIFIGKTLSQVWASLQQTNEDLELAYHNGEIADAVGSLPPKQREFVELMFWKGLNGKEIQRKTGIDRNILADAKRNLRKKLEHLKEIK